MPYKHPGPGFMECKPYLDEIALTVDLDKPSTLWKALDDYLSFCCRTGMMISNNSCYRALGLSRVTIHTWLHRTRRQHNPEYCKFAETVKLICAAAREQYGIEGQTSPLMTIWLQKAYDGFKDDPGDEIIPNPLGDMPDANKLIQKYGGLFDE